MCRLAPYLGGLQDITFEKIIRVMSSAEGTKSAGLTYGLIDELAMFLALLERGNSGAYSMDTARFLTW